MKTADSAIESSASRTRYTRISAKKIPTALTTVGTETTISTVCGGSRISGELEIAAIVDHGPAALAAKAPRGHSPMRLGCRACRSAWRWGRTA